VDAEDNAGKCEADEVEFNAVRFDGAAKKDKSYDVVEASLLAGFYFYESTQQVQLTHPEGYQSFGTGSAESVITQPAADRAAQAIATQYAEKYLRDQIPPFLSDGSEVE
jgi:hypothetical protein